MSSTPVDGEEVAGCDDGDDGGNDGDDDVVGDDDGVVGEGHGGGGEDDDGDDKVLDGSLLGLERRAKTQMLNPSPPRIK